MKLGASGNADNQRAQRLVSQQQFDGLVRHLVFDRDCSTSHGRARTVVVRNVEVNLALAATLQLFSMFFLPKCFFRPFRSYEGHNAIHPAGLQFFVRQRSNDVILLLGSIGIAVSRAGAGAVVGLLAGLVRRAHSVTSYDLGREPRMGVPGLEVEEGVTAPSEPASVSRPSIRLPK